MGSTEEDCDDINETITTEGFWKVSTCPGTSCFDIWMLDIQERWQLLAR